MKLGDRAVTEPGEGSSVCLDRAVVFGKGHRDCKAVAQHQEVWQWGHILHSLSGSASY